MYLVIGLNLPVEQPVFRDWRVAVHGPREEVGRPSSRFRGGAENRRSGTAVDLDVFPGKTEKRTLQQNTAEMEGQAEKIEITPRVREVQT